MKSITIQGTKRESVGKKSTKALRDAELVPCVVYGGKEPLNFSAEERSFKGLVYTPEAHTVSIEVDGNTIPAVLQDIQFHPITDKILHADFYQLSDDKAVVMEVPVRLTGRAKGVVAGGALRQSFRKLKLKAIPANLPDCLLADDMLHTAGIFPGGFTSHTDKLQKLSKSLMPIPTLRPRQ